MFSPSPAEPEGFRLDALKLTRIALRKQVLLDEVSLSIAPQEFIAIAGVSGAGKSTLMDALSGFRPATRGQVLINGDDLYRNFNRYRTQMGYVPQDDIIHRDLTIYQALNFSARLRLPADTSAKDRHYQIQSVLADLELTHRQHALVKQLSGGQRKRVSIGVELLTKPHLFFLDEATSGLDPGTESQMMHLLRRLADQGRTVVLVTHTTKNMMLCDKVAILAKGGKLAFYGPPQEALTYFEVQDFDDIYLKVEEERSPQEWQHCYLQSSAYQHYVQNPLAHEPLQLDTPNRIRPKFWQPQGGSAWRQFVLLSQRNLTILWQDRANLILLLAIAPVLGLLDLALWRRTIFDPIVGDSGQAFTLMFVTVLIAVMVGSLATLREIVKEAEIYRRERMIGLQIAPYLFSKVWLSVVLAFYQAAIFLFTKHLAVDVPVEPSTWVPMYFTVFLVTLGGMMMGLLVSALSNNSNVAPLLMVVFLVPQITFAGSILSLSTLGPVGQWISQLTFTRWSYESMVTLSGFGRDVAQDPCWQQPESVRQGWSEAEKAKCQCLGPHLFERCRFPGLQKEFDPAVNQAEPKQPKPLANPPQLPENVFSPEMETVRDDLRGYQDQVEAYRKDMDRWQTQFSRWKEKRGKAIAAGEALLGRVRKTQGGSYAVNVYDHWKKLGLLQLGMLGILMIVQKRKDAL